MNTLNHYEQRGTLTYQKLNYTWVTVEGWFYQSGNSVCMRKIGGRKWTKICLAQFVHDFTPHEKAGN